MGQDLSLHRAGDVTTLPPPSILPLMGQDQNLKGAGDVTTLPPALILPLMGQDPNLNGAGNVTLPPASTRRKKLIAVCGSTGTGKSQLAVELAQHITNHAHDDTRMGSEIISADSMQMYEGLDVITNKATRQEMEDVPHHMLSVLDPRLGDECDVGTFIQKANQIITRLHDDPNVDYVPIIVGGTNYYLQHLLLPGKLVSMDDDKREHVDNSDSDGGKEANAVTEDTVDQILASLGVPLENEQRQLLLRLSEKSDDHDPSALQLWKLLNVLDPKMASRWHYRDTRKTRRSLNVLLETGKRHSQWYEEQREKEQVEEGEEEDGGGGGVERMVIWIYSDLNTLRQRLDKRVDKMIERGLLQEIVELRSIARSLEQSRGDNAVDYTRGIFQTIGYKEFDEYLTHRERTFGSLDGTSDLIPDPSDDQGRKLFDHAIESMKLATRQYAKRQISWLRNRLAPDIGRKASKGIRLVILDATDPNQWQENVNQPASDIIDAFLNDAPLPLEKTIPIPTSNSPAKKSRKKAINASTADDQSSTDDRLSFVICPICTPDEPGSEPQMVLRAKWQDHIHGKVHKNAMYKRGILSRSGPDQSEEAQKKRAARQAARNVD
ncbi:tRNA isopentenyltransferase [Meira miltonrushii]|uniref:tRNA isopentenyltransferase n=1 Tax=Meira miltonrushii TaxID=1280837 RepID=A0A316V1M5_9BASI|nr:tRNA isopentenyltransferase [Meira miltonrushii]PWN31449.1 tRNA isopentenyltransferase [Meira miltonrushii]